MNAKQSLKLASARIEELEDFNRRASHEIKALNACIDSVIAGEKTYCDWCEEQNECQRECKGKAGCAEWWMMMNPPVADGEQTTSVSMTGEGSEDESKGILQASPYCGE